MKSGSIPFGAGIQVSGYKHQRNQVKKPLDPTDSNALWKDQIAYNEDLHLASLNKRQTPASHPPVNLQWKNVAGFLKLSAENH
jgi:hypothetical protein